MVGGIAASVHDIFVIRDKDAIMTRVIKELFRVNDKPFQKKTFWMGICSQEDRLRSAEFLLPAERYL